MSQVGENKPVRVLVVDDDPLVLQGVLLLAACKPWLEIIESAVSAEEALRVIISQQPDIVLADVRLGNRSGLHLAAAVRSRFPNIEVVLMTASESREMYEAANGLDVRLISKLDVTEFIDSLKGQFPAQIISDFSHLSQREIQVGKLVSRGMTNTEIAEYLGVGIETVKTYVSRAMKKLEAESRVELALVMLKDREVSN
ncbi:response regulator transcription factor [Aurantimicrobium minutum]|uniref:response regulator transcription factor n=1 Tax=Aurantimicrobium minutum TaxID=708131 RepID=UPI002475E03B|nr:response regulator transcription factor [Aurantimicrobium minutum]MDH6422279.1 DNA-binding NarL/FixJ family response regulator [Aurantimicrobium minutum]